jgi:hypothetical protein
MYSHRRTDHRGATRCLRRHAHRSDQQKIPPPTTVGLLADRQDWNRPDIARHGRPLELGAQQFVENYSVKWPMIAADPLGATRTRAVVNENRAHPRFQARLKGRLLSLDGRCNYNCVVSDVSEGGARVSTAEFGLVPTRVFLLLVNSGDIFECDVRWRREGEIGLRFIDAVPCSMRKALLNLSAVEPIH